MLNDLTPTSWLRWPSWRHPDWPGVRRRQLGPAATPQEAGAASAIDEAAQRAVIDCIRRQRPDDGFVVEQTLVEPVGQRR